MASETTQVTLWLVRESAGARYYSKLPPERKPAPSDCIWIPKSVIEHTSKTGNQHIVTLPDWVIRTKGL